MFLGWLVASLSMVVLLLGSDLDRIPVENDDGTQGYEPPENAPSIPFLSLCLLMFGIGFWFADVMGDSVVAEKAKLEPEESRGQLQSTCYSCRFFGLMVMSPVSTVLYSAYGPKCIIQLLAVVPLLILPFIYNMWEPKNLEIKSTKDQCGEIWRTVCSRAVWQPMGFVSRLVPVFVPYIIECLWYGEF
jgi:MFS family permease